MLLHVVQENGNQKGPQGKSSTCVQKCIRVHPLSSAPFHRYIYSHFVAGTLRRYPFRREVDTLSPASSSRGDTLPPVILSLGHFVAPPFRRGDTFSTEDEDDERKF